MKCIINGSIITESAVIEGKALIYEDKIINIVDNDKVDARSMECVIDAGGRYVSPGFIDIHIHGAGGWDTMDGTVEALQAISKTIAKYGVTGFLPTTMTMDRDYIYRAFEAVRKAMSSNEKSLMEGAAVLGCHMEGPFISEKHKGAQNTQFILKPDFRFIKEYLDIIKIITIAPEMDEDHSFIKKVKADSEAVLSMGHTSASYEEAMKGIKAGISHATHVFNAMTPLNHREPGTVGAVLNSGITCELIADTIHVHPAVYGLLNKVKGPDKVVLITDCMRAGCMKEGNYDLGGQKVIVKANAARLTDGTLAGSILTLNKAVKNMLENTSLEIYEAVKMASLNPARVIGMDKQKGSLSICKDSDIIIFNEDFQVWKTIIGGKVVV